MITIGNFHIIMILIIIIIIIIVRSYYAQSSIGLMRPVAIRLV